MKTQAREFRLGLLEELIDNNTFTNITNGCRDLSVVSRFDFQIPQEMLYAVQSSDGSFTILSNNVINTLISEMGPKEDRNKISADIRRKRYLFFLEISICILESDNQEEIKNFKLITKQI